MDNSYDDNYGREIVKVNVPFQNAVVDRMLWTPVRACFLQFVCCQ